MSVSLELMPVRAEEDGLLDLGPWLPAADHVQDFYVSFPLAAL